MLPLEDRIVPAISIGSTSYSTLAAAVAAANPGQTIDIDTIGMPSGGYVGGVTITTPVNIVGVGTLPTISAPAATNLSSSNAIIDVEGAAVSIANIIVDGSTSTPATNLSSGINVDSGGVLNLFNSSIINITNSGTGVALSVGAVAASGTVNLSWDNISGYDYAGLVDNATNSSVTIQNSVFTGDENALPSNGILISDGNNVAITNNVISANAVGLEIAATGTTTVSGNTVSDNSTFGLDASLPGGTATFSDNIVSGNSLGLNVSFAGVSATIADNTVSGSQGDGMDGTFLNGSITISGNCFTNNGGYGLNAQFVNDTAMIEGSTFSGDSYGLSISGANKSTITLSNDSIAGSQNDGMDGQFEDSTITFTGMNSFTDNGGNDICVSNLTGSSLTNSGILSIASDSGSGLDISSQSDISVTNTGTLLVGSSGDGMITYGLNASTTDGTVSLTNSGAIGVVSSGKSTNAFGLNVAATGDVSVTNSGTISAVAFGVCAIASGPTLDSSSGSVILNNTGAIASGFSHVDDIFFNGIFYKSLQSAITAAQLSLLANPVIGISGSVVGGVSIDDSLAIVGAPGATITAPPGSGSDPHGGIMDVEKATAFTLANVIVDGSTAEDKALSSGVVVGNGSSLNLLNATIQNVNYVSGTGVALSVPSGAIDLSGDTFLNYDEAAIFDTALGDPVSISNSTFNGNESGDGIDIVKDTAEISITGSTFTANGTGLAVNAIGNATITGNTISGNQNDGLDGGFSTGTATISDNTVSSNGGNGLNLSFTDTTTTISANNFTANAAAGLNLTSNSAISVGGNTISGNSGDGLDGTFTGATTTISGNNITGNNGYGLSAVLGGSSGDISGNALTENGTGLNVSSTGATTTISGDTISDSQDDGLDGSFGGTTTINGNTIAGNDGYGLNLGFAGTAATISANMIFGNGTGLNVNSSGSSTTISDNAISGNQNDGLDGSFYSATITNNWITDNVVVQGSITMSDSTLGGLTFNGGTLTIDGSDAIVVGNFSIDGGSVLLEQELTANGDFTLAAGTIDNEGYTLTLDGNFTNDAGADAFTDSGSEIFAGAFQMLGGTYVTAFDNLTIDGGTVTLGQDVAVDGDFTLTSGSFDDGGYTMTLDGGFYNNGDAFTSSGTEIFSGSGSQTVGGSYSTTFEDLTINGDGTVTLDQSATVVDNFTLTAGTLNLEANLSTANYTQYAGSLTNGGSGNYAVLVSGATVWTGGVMSNTGTGTGSLQVGSLTDSTATLRLGTVGGTNGSETLAGWTLTNYGTASWVGGQVSQINGSTFDNEASLTLATAGGWEAAPWLQSSGTWSWGTVSTGTLSNEGTITEPANTGAIDLTVSLVNSGTVSVASGTVTANILNLGGSVDDTDGAWQVGSDSSGSVMASVVFSGGGTTSGTFALASDGTVIISNGNLTVTNAIEFGAGLLSLTGGTLTLGSDFDLDNFSQSGGMLTNSSDDTSPTLTIDQSFVWTGGSMTGSGTTNSYGTLQLGAENDSNAELLDGWTLNNDGVGVWTNGAFYQTDGSAFDNQAEGTLTINSANNWYTPSSLSSSGPSTLSNEGILNVAVSSGSTVWIGVTINSLGNVYILSGALSLQGGGSDDGSFTVPANTTLTFGGSGTSTTNLTIDSNISGDGTVEFSAGSTVNVAGSYDFGGLTLVQGGTLNFVDGADAEPTGTLQITSSGTISFNTGNDDTLATLTLSDGSVTGTDDVTVNSLLWTGGAISGTGTMDVEGSLQLGSASDSSNLTLDGWTLNNDYLATFAGSGAFYQVDGSTFNNQAEAGLIIENAEGWYTPSGFSSTGPSAFNNFGSVTVDSDGGTSWFGVAFNNAGTVQVQSGTLSLQGGGSDDGSFSISAGADLQFNGGSNPTALSDSSYINGAGILEVVSGTITEAGTLDLAGTVLADSSGTLIATSGANIQLIGWLSIFSGTVTFDSGNPVVISMLDQTGGTLNGSDTLTVNSSQGGLDGVGNNLIAVAGSDTGTVVVATFSAAGYSNPTDIPTTISWGDSTTSIGTVTFNSSTGLYTVTGDHTYATAGLRTITTDVPYDNGMSPITASAQVDGLPVDVTGLAVNAAAGVNITVPVATFIDPNGAGVTSNYSAFIDWGDGGTSTGAITESNGVFTVTGTYNYASASSYTITVTVVDEDHNSGTATAAAKIGTPVLTAGIDDLQADQNNTVSGVIASFTDSNSAATLGDFTASINWGDSHTASGTIVENASGDLGVEASYTYGAVGVYTFTVTIHDNLGNSTSASATATVGESTVSVNALNVAPTLKFGFDGIVADFSDAGPWTDASDFTATINWGDSSTGPATSVVNNGDGTFGVEGTHTYTAVGSFPITVIVTDGANETGTASGTATVTALSMTPEPDTLILAQTENFSGTVITFDSNSGLTDPTPFSASINWGDGTTSEPDAVTIVADPKGGFDVQGTHTYTTPNSYPISVSLTDTNGDDFTGQSTASVQAGNVAITPTTILAAAANQPFSGVLASFNDINSSGDPTVYQATIDWGDGTTGQPDNIGNVLANDDGSFSIAGDHTYTAAGTYTVTLTLFDASGTPYTANTSVVVQANPIVVNVDPIAPTQQQEFSDEVATFTQIDPEATDFSASISWGDGHTTAGSIVANDDGSFSVYGDYTYASSGPFNLSVTVSDNDTPENSVTASNPITVAPGSAPTAPSIATNDLSAAVNVPTLTSQPLAGFKDPSGDTSSADFSVVVAWGDSDSSTLSSSNLVSDGKGGFNVEASHTYLSDNADETYTITVTNTIDSPAFSVSATGDIFVSPAVVTVQSDALSLAPGQAFSGEVATFSDIYDVPGTSTYSSIIKWGDGQTSAGTIVANGSGGYSVDGNHTYAAPGTFQVTAIVFAGDGYSGDGTGSAVVAVPFAAVGSSATAVQNQSFAGTLATFTGPSSTISDYAASIDWDDGDVSAGTIVTNNSGGFSVVGNESFTASGSFLATVTITGPAGAQITANATIDVAPAPLLASVDLLLTGAAGLTFTQTVASFSTSDATATPADFSATINWGDGTSLSTGSAVTIVDDPNGGFDVQGNHSYSATGSFTVSVTIKDNAGDSASATSTVNVVTASIVATPADFDAVTGAAYDDTVATFISTNPSAQTTDFTATITWNSSGNSSATTTGTIVDNGDGSFSVEGTYTYASAGSNPVTVSINGPLSTSAQASETATVADIAVSTNDLNLDTGVAFSDTVAYFQTALTATLTASINWGDGTTSAPDITTASIVADPLGGFDVDGSHTYATAGSYDAVVTVWNPSDTSETGTDTATVAVAAGQISVTAASITPVEHQTFTGTVATFSAGGDAEPGDFSATIDWGDGSAPTTISFGSGSTAPNIIADPDGGYDVVGTHTYTDMNPYTMIVTVSDLASDTPGSDTATVQAVPLNVVDSSLNLQEGQVFSGTVATIQDADMSLTPADFQVEVTWGDGSTSDATVVPDSTSGVFDVQASHQYESAGQFQPTIAVIDSDGNIQVGYGSAYVSEDYLEVTAASPTAAQGRSTSLILATITDPGATGLSAQINWGSGASVAGTIVDNGNGTFSVVGKTSFSTLGTQPVTVTVSAGSNSETVTSDVNVATATFMATPVDSAAVVNLPFTDQTLATFYAVDAGAVVGDFTANINWGDSSGLDYGTTIAANADGSFSVEGNHSYSAIDDYSVQVNIQGPSGPPVTVTATINVAAIQITTALQVEQGQLIDGTVATFTTSDTSATAADFTPIVTWGDGGTSEDATVVVNPAGGFDVQASYQYASAGEYQVQVTVFDTSNNAITAEAPLQVSPDTMTVTGTSLTDQEGVSFTSLLATVYDPMAQVAGDLTAVSLWSDGTKTTDFVTRIANNTFTITGGEIPLRAGITLCSVSVLDPAGQRGFVTDSVFTASALTPLNAAPVFSVVAGSSVPGTLASFTDTRSTGAAYVYTATINWGDGNSSNGTVMLEPNGVTYGVTGTHPYVGNGGQFPLTITITNTATNDTTDVLGTVNVVPGVTTTWLGNGIPNLDGSKNWSDAVNWSNGVPTILSNVQINTAGVVINISAGANGKQPAVNSITMPNAGTLKILGNFTINGFSQVAGQFVINNNASLTLGAGANLILTGGGNQFIQGKVLAGDGALLTLGGADGTIYAVNAGFSFGGTVMLQQGVTLLQSAALANLQSIPVNYQNLQINGGTLVGLSGQVVGATPCANVSGSLTWYGGMIVGWFQWQDEQNQIHYQTTDSVPSFLVTVDGRVTIGSNAFPTDTANLWSCTLTNNAYATWNGGKIHSDWSSFVNNGDFSISGNVGEPMVWTSSGDVVNFINNLTFYQNNVNTFFGVPFINNFSVDIPEGNFVFAGGGSAKAATFTFGSGTVVGFSSGFDMDETTSVDSQSVVQFLSGAVNVAGTYSAITTSIEGGALIINGVGDSDYGTLTNKGTLGGTGTFYIHDEFIWTGGDMSGATELTSTTRNGTTVILPGATLIINDASAGETGLGMTNRTLDNYGNIEWLGNGVLSGKGSTINNYNTFAANGNINLLNSTIANSVFNNEGSFEQLAQGNDVVTNLSFTWYNIDTGSLTVPFGTLQFGGGGSSTTALLELGSGVTLAFAGGEFYLSGTIDTDVALRISGGIANFSDPENNPVDVLDLQIAGGTANFATAVSTDQVKVTNGTANFQSTFHAEMLEILGGTVNCCAASDSPEFIFSGGTLCGNGTFTITGECQWVGGTMSGSGSTEINRDAVLLLGNEFASNVAQLGLGRRLDNNGTIRSEGSCTIIPGSGTPSLYDYGTFEVGDDTVAIEVPLYAVTTTLTIDDGNLVLAGGGSSEASIFNITGVGALIFDRTPRNNPTFTFDACSSVNGTSHAADQGVVSFQGGTVTFSGGSYNVYATNIVGGEVDFNNSDLTPDNSFTTGDLVLGTSESSSRPGVLSGNGTIQVTSSLTWSGGTMTGGGVTWIKNGASLMVASGANGTASNRTINNDGTQGYFYSGASVTFTGGVTFNNRGPLEISDNVTISAQGAGNTFNNYNSIVRIGLPYGNTTINVLFQNYQNARVSIDSGSLIFESGWAAESVGTWIVRAGGELVLAGGSSAYYNVPFSDTFQFLGRLPSLNFPAGTVVNPAALAVAGGTLNLSMQANLVVPYLTLTGGTITGPGQLTVTGRMLWMGGDMTDTAQGVGNTTVNNGATTIAAGATLYMFGTLTLKRYLNIAKSSTTPATETNSGWYVWVGGGAVISTANFVGTFQNNQAMTGGNFPAASTFANPAQLNAYLSTLQSQRVAGYGNARDLAATMRAILAGIPKSNLGYSSELVWRWLAGLLPIPQPNESDSTTANPRAMPALQRAAMAYAFYYSQPANTTRVPLINALITAAQSFRTNEWKDRVQNELFIGSSKAQTLADDLKAIGQTLKGFVQHAAPILLDFATSASTFKAIGGLFMDVSRAPELPMEKVVRETMERYMSQGASNGQAILMAVLSNHPLGGQQFLSAYEGITGVSVQPGQVGAQLSYEQRRNQLILVGVDVVLTFVPVGTVLRGGARVLSAVAMGAARLAVATGIRLAPRMATLVTRLGTLATRLTGAAAGAVASPVRSVSSAITRYLSCFPAGTSVATVEGLRNIESVQAGEDVWAFDLVEREWRACKVLQTFERFYDGDMSKVTVAGEMIDATYFHPFWVVRGEDLIERPVRQHLPLVPANAAMPGRWVDAADLRVGDELLLRNGRISTVEAVEHYHFEGMVYNFHVEFLECYAVGKNSVLVHNTNGPVSSLIATMARRLNSVLQAGKVVIPPGAINFGATLGRRLRRFAKSSWGAIIGQFHEHLGKHVVENIADWIVRATSGAIKNGGRAGFRAANNQIIDRLLTLGQRTAIVEIKTVIPRFSSAANSSFQRMIGQIREGVDAINAMKAAARTAGAPIEAQFTIWSLRPPTNAQLRAMERALGPAVFNQVQFVHGVDGFHRWIRLFFQV